MKKTLRSTLLTWFLTFSIIATTIFLICNSIYINQKEKITDVLSNIYDLHLDVQKDFNVTDAFLTYETNNPGFFENHESEYINDHNDKLKEINSKIQDISSSWVTRKMGLSTSLDSIERDFDRYALIFNQLVELIMERGFKDYGTVGKMREYIHELESFEQLEQTYILGLRRHEKDFIIRNEEQYVEKLNQLGNEFALYINNSNQLKPSDKDYFIKILNGYLIEFNKIVDLDKRIGIKTPGEGKKNQLEKLENNIENKFNYIINRAEEQKIVLFRYIELFYGVFFLAFLAISILLSRLVSKNISAPLTLLTGHIKNLSAEKLESNEDLEHSFSNYETSILYKEFSALLDEIKKERDGLNQVQKALLENEEKYRELADYLPQSVFETDHFGNLTYVNSTWLKSFRYSQQDFSYGLSVLNFLKSENGPLMLGNETKGSTELIAFRKDGTTFPALVYTNKINRDNKMIGFRGVVIDITERKNRMDRLRLEKEKAEQADKLKSAFLTNMSHEIRTPMNAIIGFSNLLTNKELSEESKEEYLSHIQGSGKHLLKLIDDIIDISRIEAGEIVIKKQSFMIRELFEELLFTFKNELKKANKEEIALAYSIPEGNQEFAIYSDPYRLRQVFSNLISNAVKFTHSGRIDFGYTFGSEGSIIFYVNDTGIGMGKTEQVDAFDRFVQIENNENISYEGTGLGLSISKNLIELLGGRMWVESEIGKGSKFSFTLKAESVKYTEEKPADMIQFDNIDLNLRGKTILIAEDNDTNFIYLKALFKPTNGIILRAKTGRESVELITNHSDLCLVLMDIQMPEMDGFEAIKKIKEINPIIPVICQTAFAMRNEREKILDAGFDDHISKPINERELLGKVVYHINKKTLFQPDNA